MILPSTIDEVITRLDTILETTISNGSSLGLFAALYQKVTIKVRQGIVEGRFEDGPRMEKLDVIFANRYIEAYEQYSNGISPTRSWQLAFDAAKNSKLIILQHLLLGMNAHINLDLGIAAAEVAPGQSIHALKKDFTEINNLLFEMVDEIQDDISKVSPLLGLFDFLIKGKDEQLAKFSMKKARQHAWLVAQRFALVSFDQREKAIKETDDYVFELGRLILSPGWIGKIGIGLINLMEEKNNTKSIAALRISSIS